MNSLLLYYIISLHSSGHRLIYAINLLAFCCHRKDEAAKPLAEVIERELRAGLDPETPETQRLGSLVYYIGMLLANQFRSWAEQLEDQWLRTGQLLRDIADGHARDARYEDASAEKRADMD